MNGLTEQYPQAPSVLGQAAYNPTIRERLVAQRDVLTTQLNNVNAAIKALDENPDLEQFLVVIGKVGY